MKRFVLCSVVFFFWVPVFSQNAVILQHAGNPTPFYGSNGYLQAYDAAVHGDTIYLPGGFFQPPSPVNKRIAVIGAGHHPDTTSATLPTVLVSGFSISEEADSCFLSGFRVNGGITFDHSASINGFTFSRLYVDGPINSSGGANSHHYGNISECIIVGEISGPRFLLCNVVNNIILYRINEMVNSMIANNIFLSAYNYYGIYRSLYGLSECVVRNNIFYYGLGDLPGCINNQFIKNIFANDPPTTNNSFSANYNNEHTTNLFVSYDGSAYSYGFDLHLKLPANYPGTDNTQVGLYGSAKPWKEGSVPLNPHIISKNISENSDANGVIQVQLKVAAQDR
ncbi:MAG TPA: hypothetical protein VK907_01370 [Phnomibacter sp.]|nr:hypothetical protein [Phnomibacter sp.]